MKFYSLLSVLLLCKVLHCHAQDSLNFDRLVPGSAVKFSPLHLLNFYPTVEVSYEQKLYRRVTLQAEVGYIVNYRVDYKSRFDNKRGVKLKLEPRYYFWGRTDKKKMYYASAEPYFYVINFDRNDSREECFDVECTSRFRRTYHYKVKYRESGFTLKAGYIRYYARFFLDFNSGLTLRNIRYYEPDWVEPGLEESFIFVKIPNEEDRITVSPHLCVRLGYRLK